MSTRIGIMGYGNLGRGVELAVFHAPDMELAAVFTRREPDSVKIKTPDIRVYKMEEARKMRAGIDVMILCGGSARDLPVQGPEMAALFNTVDSFDTHADIPDYLAAMGKAAVKTAAVVSAGWDPGLFSMARLLSEAVLPDGSDYTFWGPGVSQGHSEAVRGVAGVKNAVQYTRPDMTAIDRVRNGETPELSAGQRHKRECFVVAEEGAGLEEIEREIVEMPHYFAGYDTSVRFISQEEFDRDHAGKMPHGGSVFRAGTTGRKHRQVMEFSLKLDSNPEFTASIMAAYARAAARLSREGNFGAKTAFDIPLSYLLPGDHELLIKELM